MANLELSSLEKLSEELVHKDSIPVANREAICEDSETAELKNEVESLLDPERKDISCNGANFASNLTANGSGEEPPGLISLTEGGTAPKEDILCDFCLGDKSQAVKSCLTCMVNYCQDHLRPHLEIAKLQTHKLRDPLKDIDMQSCETHKSHLSWFCHHDLACVCEECLANGHQGHKTVPCAVARKEKEVNDLFVLTCY